MKEGGAEELRRAAERASAEVRDALFRHAEVMSKSSVRYAAVAEADDRVIDALNIYRESAERITGLSALLRVRVANVASEDWCEILDRAGDEDDAVAEEVILEARWHLNVADPRLMVTVVRGEESTARSDGRMAGAGGGVNNRDLRSALAALFERDVPWPPSEYSEIGLTVTGMSISVHASDQNQGGE